MRSGVILMNVVFWRYCILSFNIWKLCLSQRNNIFQMTNAMSKRSILPVRQTEDFNVTVQKVIDMVSYGVVSKSGLKLSLAMFWWIIKEKYVQSWKRLLKYFFPLFICAWPDFLRILQPKWYVATECIQSTLGDPAISPKEGVRFAKTIQFFLLYLFVLEYIVIVCT